MFVDMVIGPAYLGDDVVGVPYERITTPLFYLLVLSYSSRNAKPASGQGPKSFVPQKRLS